MTVRPIIAGKIYYVKFMGRNWVCLDRSVEHVLLRRLISFGGHF